ncbi:MAG: hypothetical protein ABSD96_23020 [Candidatus Korobacteraceae bacterium]|jgi:hypothetical protein
MALRSCQVSCRDLAGVEHAVEVTAESLYEAVAQALGILRGDTWVEEIGEGLTELKVRVKQPAVEHRVEDEGFQAVAGVAGEDAGRVHEEEEVDSAGERGRRGAVNRDGRLHHREHRIRKTPDQDQLAARRAMAARTQVTEIR